MSQKDPKVVEIVLPQDIYASYLKVINGIPFTRREIEIISCVLSGRSAKKIASFLSISPKTVENHIRNVMLKLGCKSQESIRDFIEKSGKFTQVKKYYSSLLIQANFELQLNKISVLTAKNRPICIIIYDSEQTQEMPLLNQLQRHLNLAGVKTAIEIRERYQSTNNLTDKIESQQVNYIIYSLPAKFIEQPKTVSEIEDLPITHFIQANSRYSSSIITLLLDRHHSVPIPKELIDSSCIDLAEQGNYYFLAFEALKKLLPNVIIDKNIVEFKLQCEILHDSSFSQTEIEKNQQPLKENINQSIISALKKENRRILFRAGFCLIAFFGCILSYNNDENRNNKSEEMKSLNAQSVSLGSLNALQTQIKTSAPISWNLPRQDHTFVGRENLLDELDKKLHSKEKFNLNEPMMVSVCAGLGGVGKTQLALQYVHHSKNPYTLRAWFASENTDQLKQQYIEFAKILGYREEKPSTKTAIPYIKEWLSKNPGWLLVYDNVNTYEEIKEFLPENNGSIILTTRQQKWPSGFKTLDIDVMHEEESIALIQSLIRRKIVETEKESAKELVKMLGYLPLALAQASAYIRQNQITIVEYLEFYKNHEQKLLADNTLPEGTSSLPVAINWNISLEAIAKEAKATNQPPLALDLLSACAYLAPERIPHNLLLIWLKNSYPRLADPELVLAKLIGQLWQYSMINREENGDITVHRLVQAVVRQQHKQALNKSNSNYPSLTLEWYNTMLKGIHAEFYRKTQTSEDEMRKKNLLPHLQILLNHYKQLWPNDSEFSLIPIINDIGTAFFLIGEPKNSKFYYERALPILEQHHNKNHFELAYTLEQLGRVYRHLGNGKQAKEFHERALKIKEQYYGKDHAEIAYTLDQLGRDYKYLGDIKAAKELHERALKIKEQHYDKDHVELSFTLEQLGRAYRHLGDAQKAKELHEHALKIKEQYYGKDHAEIAFVIEQLGTDYRNLGDAKKAKELHERALKIKEQYYKKDHIEIAHILIQLGSDYRDLGDAQKAKELHEHVLVIYEQYYDQDHVDMAYALDRLGRDYRYLGDTKRAKELHERAVQLKEQYYGKDHIEVAFVLIQLGRDYRDLGDVKKAKELHERALKIKEQFYGKDHTLVAFALNQLGKDYKDLGDAQKAKELHERALKLKVPYYGDNHPETAKTLTNLGSAYTALNDAKQGKIHLEKALVIKEVYFGMDHPEVAETLIELGNAYKSLKNTKQSQMHLKRALKIREKYYGQDHILTIEAKRAIT